MVRETNVNALMHVLGKFFVPKVGRNVVRFKKQKNKKNEENFNETNVNALINAILFIGSFTELNFPYFHIFCLGFLYN